MLYLMMDKTDKEYLVKVGFSDRQNNLNNRRKAYYSYNPRAIMRSSCAGNTAMEQECRIDLIKWGGTRIKGTEWFIISEELFWELYKKGMKAFRPKHEPIHFLEEF
jgi:hypothetical protein